MISQLQFSWPLTVTILGVLFIILFFKPIYRLIDRTLEIGKSGLKTSPPVAPTPSQTSEITEIPSEVDVMLRKIDNPFLAEKEAVLRKEIDDLKIGHGAERDKLLTKALAFAANALKFERVYQRIWGSQLLALEYINNCGSNGCRIDVLRPYYENVKASNPELVKNYSFDQWFKYLLTQSFIAQKEDSTFITLEGQEFLKYLIQFGYTIYKQW